MAVAIGVVGCAGRMGRAVIQEVMANESCSIAGGTESQQDYVGKDIGELVGAEATQIKITDDPKEVFVASDVVIDFTIPMATRSHAQIALETQTALVVGTTGLSQQDQEAITAAAQSIAIVQASNFSVGVNLLFALTKRVAATLGPDYDIDILEMHHRHKVDAPSGTAISLGEAAAAGRQVQLEDVSCFAREGQVGPRPSGEIGFATLRGGGVIGDHTAIFANEVERLELTHKAGSRGIFAGGAVRAALWLQNRAAGLYSMSDVLDLN